MCSSNGNWIIFIILVIKIEFTMAITTWNMHDLCGANLDVRMTAGEIFFNTRDLPESLAGNTCRLSLRAPSTSYTNYMIMFYFTQFKFYDLCTDANMTFIDGSSLTDRTISGLPHTVCGINSTLEKHGLYFTSRGGDLKIIFNKNHIAFSNIFTIKFISYHIGSCDTDSSYECSNGNCIPYDYVCSDEIDSCGISYDTSCMSGNSTTPTPVESTVASIFAGITSLAFFGVIVISMFCFVRMHRHSHRGNLDCCRSCCEMVGECVRKCCDGLQSIGRQCSDCADGITTRIQSAMPSTNEVSQQSRSEPTNRQTSLNFELSAASDSGSNIPDNPPVTPSAPPPEYTSIMDAPPSYEDVISTEGRNQRNYMKN